MSHVPLPPLHRAGPGPLVCVNIDNNRECPGACMQFFSVSNVQVYSLPPVALRGDCEGWFKVAHVSSGGMWQGVVEPRR